MVDEGGAHAEVSAVVGVETVGVGVVEIAGHRVGHGIEPGESREVDYGDCPHVARFLDGIDVGLKVFAASVLIFFGALPVGVVGIESAAVDGCQQHNLLFGIGAFQTVHGYVDASAERLGVHGGDASHACLLAAGVSVTILGLFHPFVIPSAKGHGVVIVVGAHENDYGIYVLPVFFEQLRGLTRHVVPLAPADGVDPRSETELLGEHGPILL